MRDTIQKLIDEAGGNIQAIEQIRDVLHELSPINSQPVDRVRWVPVEIVEPNDYNPNSVASKEMKLLYISIKHDGYTQPIVTIWDDQRKKYVIVDGFHRYFTCKNNPDIYERNQGLLPIVVIKKTMAERMAATVRHNKARGSHSIDGQSNIVFSMLAEGRSDAEICNEIGIEPDQLVRLKHTTGFSKLFEDAEYKRAWVTRSQLRIKKDYQDKIKASHG